MNSGFRIISHTEHSLVWAPPPTMTGRRPDGRHAYTEEIARVHARRAEVEPFEFVWDHGNAVGFPKLRVRQLATWTDWAEIKSALGPRPGAFIIEAYAVGWCGARKPRPIALYPGGDLANWREFAWFDAHTGRPMAAVSTDFDDLDVDVVIVESLVDAAVRWGLPRDPHVPDIIVIDPALVRRTGRRGMALVEKGDMTVAEVDSSQVVISAYSTLGPKQLAEVSGITLDAAKKLKRRRPKSAKLARLVGATHTDPQALGTFAQKAAASARRCAFGDCPKTIPPRRHYCPEHSALVRRERDRNRKRAARARTRSTP